ncbi:MAG TPA: M20/M25/M40 family metallo-hydrolase [Bryobacteraceae bacterium]|nr:M20/M25/M40 family metallo-hydrolase [Bryobacteraceae bacterium]
MRKLLLLLVVPFLLAEEAVDLNIVNRIKTEAFENSKVMEHAFYLSDVHGPRLSGSPEYDAAAEWTVKRMREMGLSNARLEKWGPYGRSWANRRFYGAMKSPVYQPLVGVPRPLSLGTKGLVSGEAVLAPLRTEADFGKFKGKLKGKIVLLEEPRPVPPQTEPVMRRLSDAELTSIAQATDPAPRPVSILPGRPGEREARARFNNKLNQFLLDEGVLVTLVVPYRGNGGGTVFSTPAGSRNLKDPLPPAAVTVTPEHYNRVARLLARNIPVTLEFDIDNRVYSDSPDTFNLLADLPGGEKKDEVVLVGGHFDSWTFGTGAADNAAGCAVAIEAIRILKALNLKMARTVRVGLWAAEEQGLLGSLAYVKDHLGDRETMELKPGHAKLSGYFNLDNGSGKIRGVYLQGNDMMRPVFEAWLGPFRDLGAGTVTIRNTTSTDHIAFDAVGIPAFQFIQDPVEYGRMHHSNMDTYDRLQESDLMQASAVLASVVYHAATRPDMLPRKPLPKAQPKKTE